MGAIVLGRTGVRKPNRGVFVLRCDASGAFQAMLDTRRMDLVRPDALLFDMDGLLVDSEPLWWEVERAFARSRGATWTDDHARACVGRGLAATLEAMRELLEIPVDVERDAAAIIDAFIAHASRLRLKPGGDELIRAAHGRVPLALASSSAQRLIDAVLARFDLGDVFGAVVSGESVAHPKPAPDIFLRAAELLGVDARSSVVLEDSLAGATAGHRAGAFVIAVPEGAWEGRGFEAVADAIVPDLLAARALLDLG
jgi:HAD superfamily hydrolase (TIGR01509 family)